MSGDGAKGKNDAGDRGVAAPRHHVLAVGCDVTALVAEESSAWAASGCIVACSQTGVEALRELLNQRYAVVLVGASLPDLPASVFIEEVAKLAPFTGIVSAAPAPREGGVAPNGVSGPAGVPAARVRVLHQPRAADVRQAAVALVEGVGPDPEYRQAGILHSLNRIEEIIVSTAHTEDALGDVCVELAELTDCAAASIYLLRSSSPCFVIGSPGPVPPPLAALLRQEAGASFERLATFPLLIAEPVLRVRDDQAAPAPPDAHVVTVPLLADRQVKGVLCVACRTPVGGTPLLPATLFHLGNHAVLIYQEVWRARNMAARDPLTGLYNRGMFTEALKQAFSLAQRKAATISVLIFDLDHLKTINDHHGHLAGDKILREVADVALAVVRTADIVARFGGDEFAVVLPDADLPSVRRVADRLLGAFRARTFAAAGGQLRLTVSVGIASLRPTRESSAQVLLTQADEALMAAKRAGRDRVCEPGGGAAPPTPTPTADPPPAAGEMRGRVLVVDDEKTVRDILGRMMRVFKFEAVTCSSLEEAFREIETRPDEFDIVLTDLHLGNGTGIDLLQALKVKAPWTVKMVVSGYASKETAIACLRHGAFDFIEKPFAYEQIATAMDRALEYRRLLVANRRYQVQLEELVRSRSESLTQALDSLRRSYTQTIQALAAMTDAREAGTGRHCRITREAVRLLARQVDVSHHDLDALEMGAVLHDIGKIGIPDAVLLKSGPLTAEERHVIQAHPRIGYDLLRGVPFLQDAAQIVLHHHERYDGSGYPSGLKGEAICLGARVFAVVDAYHAMRSTRCYREALSEQAARDEIVRGAGHQFDPAIVAAFVKCQPEIEAVCRVYPDVPPPANTA